MTKLEAVKLMVSKLELRGVRSPSDDEDEEIWNPNPQDLEMFSALVDRPVTEDELWFRCGGNLHGTYGVLNALLEEIKL